MADWTKILSRGNVEDRRGSGPVGVGGLSLTGVALLLVFNYLTGGDPLQLLADLSQVPIESTQQVDQSQYAGSDEYEVFAATVLGSNNETWSNIFNQQNRRYVAPKLVLFRNATNSGCGLASSEVGPHYCPPDATIYLDETFFDELTNRLGAQGGDVAQAYVMAHEVAHHVQNQLGTMDRVHAGSGLAGPDNELSIKLELQADCYAGIWANSIRELGILQPNEIGEAMDAAAAVGDDRIQENAMGYSNPESWTHGSSEQRVEWFTRGYEQGSLAACDTFAAP